MTNLTIGNDGNLSIFVCDIEKYSTFGNSPFICVSFGQNDKSIEIRFGSCVIVNSERFGESNESSEIRFGNSLRLIFVRF